MIIDFSFNFKSFLKPFEIQKAYDSHIALHHSSFSCPNPNCSHIAPLVYSTSYDRYLLLDCDSEFSIRISVFKCPVCSTYHAILPACIFPYSSYSYPFIMKTLYLFYLGVCKGNKSLTCEHMHISRKVLNHFILLFSYEEVSIFHKTKPLLSILAKMRKQPNVLYDFLFTFIHKHRRPFLLYPPSRPFLFHAYHQIE